MRVESLKDISTKNEFCLLGERLKIATKPYCEILLSVVISVKIIFDPDI